MHILEGDCADYKVVLFFTKEFKLLLSRSS